MIQIMESKKMKSVIEIFKKLDPKALTIQKERLNPMKFKSIS